MGAPDLLRVARDSAGRSPDEWLSTALPPNSRPVIDIARVPHAANRLVFVGQAGRSTASALAHPAALPLSDDTAEGIRVTMCLHSLEALDGLFAELRRVLRPAGTLAVLLPARPGWTLPEIRAWRPLHRAVGPQRHPRHTSARDHPSWLLAGADFAVLTDQQRLYWLPLPDEPSAASALTGLTSAGLLGADLAPESAHQAHAVLTRAAGPGARLPIRLRLVVGRR
jgi:SAM-dependent methyltransferase